MTPIDPGLAGYLLLLAVMLAHEPWRWLGLLIGARIDTEGEVFRWVRAVANAIVAGLVMRLLIFPAGAMAGVPLVIRLAGLAIGIAAYFALGRSVGLGIAVGTAAFIALKATGLSG